MHLALSVIAAVVTVYGVIWLILLVDRRVKTSRAAANKRRRQARVLGWVEEVERSLGHHATAKISPLTLSGDDMHLDDERRETAAVNKYKDAKYYTRSEYLGAEILRNPRPYNVALQYLTCHTESLDSWIAFKLDASKLGEYFQSCINETLKRAQAGDQLSISGFEFLMDRWDMVVPFCKDFGIDPPRFPDNWGSVVTRRKNK